MNKTSKLSKILGHASTLASAGGAIAVSTSCSLDGVVGGLRVMCTASAVGNAAGAVGGLAEAEGRDIAFSGGSSDYKEKNPKGDIRLLIKAEQRKRPYGDLPNRTICEIEKGKTYSMDVNQAIAHRVGRNLKKRICRIHRPQTWRKVIYSDYSSRQGRKRRIWNIPNEHHHGNCHSRGNILSTVTLLY